MFFRKVIYIGESQGQAIYVHVDEPRNPLAAPKSINFKILRHPVEIENTLSG